MKTLQTLREELAAIQTALAEDDLERLPLMIDAYRSRLHTWMSTGIADSAEPLRQLHTLHRALIYGLQQRQHQLQAQMQAERHSSRAARTYLSSLS